jgi:hypothetical protein
MKSFALKDGDIVIENGELVMVEEQEETVQSIQIGIGTHKGEWFLDLEEGINFLLMVDKTVSEAEKREEIYNTLMKQEQIKSVESIDFHFDRSTRALTVSFQATSTEGESIESEVMFNVG